MRVAVVGSRDYPYLDDVRALVQLIAKDHPTATIVSGGARGTDSAAEQQAQALGLQVHSFRVWQKSQDECGVEEWWFGPEKNYVRQMVEQPTFGNAPGALPAYVAALSFRNSLIAEHCDRLVSFHWTVRDRGTSLTEDFAKAYGKPIKRYDESWRFGQVAA